MIEFILVWVLVVPPSTSQNSPIISTPVLDIESCERMRVAINADMPRRAQCVQVKVPVVTLPKK